MKYFITALLLSTCMYGETTRQHEHRSNSQIEALQRQVANAQRKYNYAIEDYQTYCQELGKQLQRKPNGELGCLPLPAPQPPAPAVPSETSKK